MDVAVPDDVVLAPALVDDGAEVVTAGVVGAALAVADGRAVEAVEPVEDAGLDAVAGLDEAVGRGEVGVDVAGLLAVVAAGVVAVGALVGDDVAEGAGVVKVPVVG